MAAVKKPKVEFLGKSTKNISANCSGDNTMIPYVTWKDFYSVGDPSIDAQHKQIIGAINDLYEAMQKRTDRAVLKPILDRLLQYTLAHFEHEEQVMRENEYPDFVQHKALHDRIRKKTSDLREHAGLVTGHELLHFLKEWWVGHIQSLDKKYTPYLEQSASHLNVGTTSVESASAVAANRPT